MTDLELFRRINQAHAPWADFYFGQIAGLGDGLVALGIAFAIAAYRPLDGWRIVLAIAIAGLAAQVLKHAIGDVPRPPAVLANVHLLGAPLAHHSFPSGHASTAGALAAASLGILWARHRLWALLGAIVAASAAWARIYGGVHWPSDVAAGFLLGLLGWWLAVRALRGLSNPKKAQRIAAALAVLSGTGLVLVHHVQPSTAKPTAAVVGIGAVAAAWWAHRSGRLR